VHLVFGFTALTEFRTKIAREEFEQAIDLDSADPLARFGLGLAIIRDGALAEGRRYLEMAVGFDSSNSLLRSSVFQILGWKRQREGRANRPLQAICRGPCRLSAQRVATRGESVRGDQQELRR